MGFDDVQGFLVVFMDFKTAVVFCFKQVPLSRLEFAKGFLRVHCLYQEFDPFPLVSLIWFKPFGRKAFLGFWK